MKKNNQEYGADQIQALEGLEPVRKRPGMYIGSTDEKGLHHLIYEVVDNSIDESLAGYCTKIKVEVLNNNIIRISDNGRGIPTEIMPKFKKSALEIVMTKLHAGGKFDNNAYKVSGGTHGVGVSAVNALSEWMKATSMRNGKTFTQKYEKGIPITKVKFIEDTDKTGTIIEFKPDNTIFETTSFNIDTIKTRLRELSYLNKGVKIVIYNELTNKMKIYKAKGGIASYVTFLNKVKTPIQDEVIYFHKKEDSTKVEVALQYTDSYAENVMSFANNINTHEGGTHLMGFKTALTRSLNNYGIAKNLIKNSKTEGGLSGEDYREGLTGIISVKLKNPQFEGQTKTKLGNSEVKSLVERLVKEGLDEFLEEHPRTAKQIIQKALQTSEAREAARKARQLVQNKHANEIGTLPGKLADCSERDARLKELYIVEGTSAGGCIFGKTKIALTDGRNISFKKLVKEHNKGKANYCYTIKNDGHIGLEKIENPRKTKSNTKVIKIILDNDEEIICTPDHKFMLRDRSYKQAKDLKTTDSLMPLRKTISIKGKNNSTIDGYELVWNSKNNKWIFTHILSDHYNLSNKTYSISDGDTRHHVNFNKLDNNPNNIKRMKGKKHIKLHQDHIEKTLHTWETKVKTASLKRTIEYRNYMSNRMKESKTREMLSLNAKILWSNNEYKTYMKNKWKEFYNNNEVYRRQNNLLLERESKKYWSKPENRENQSEHAKQFFEMHPEAKELVSQKSIEQWKDKDLLKWRAKKTSEQWTPEFRSKRLQTLYLTYFKNTIIALKQFEIKGKLNIKEYDKYRINLNNKSLLKFDTFCKRYFENNKNKAIESVSNFNHKIKSIEYLKEKMDVYDLEVPNTHNFALSSGIFVHNSAKQGRDRRFQAILPLRGKVLNVEKAGIMKIIKNEEIQTLIKAIGLNVSKDGLEDDDETTLSNTIRYHKIIIMTDADVDGCLKGDTPIKLLDTSIKTIEELSKLYPSENTKFSIYATNDNGDIVPAQAHSVRITKYVNELYEIELHNGKKIYATENHPFKLFSGKYVRADKLSTEDHLMTMHYNIERDDLENNYNHKIVSISKFKTETPIPVYDMTVEKYHNFAIDLGDNSCIFVHNSHIKTLLLTLFYRYMRKLFELGYIYVAKPPLYKLKKGKAEYYVYNDEELNKKLAEIGKDGVTMQRYKGLGEMNPQQLWSTTMDPKKRTLVQIVLNGDKEDEINDIFEVLMGDDIESRRDFIETHAHEAEIESAG